MLLNITELKEAALWCKFLVTPLTDTALTMIEVYSGSKKVCTPVKSFCDVKNKNPEKKVILSELFYFHCEITTYK